MWIAEANAMIIMATIVQSHHCIRIEAGGVALAELETMYLEAT